MRKVFLLILLSVGVSVQAQVSDILLAMSKSHREVTVVDSNRVTGRETLFVPVNYDQATITDHSELRKIDADAIERIDLVYTRFSIDPAFNQRGLNRRRVQELARQFPKIASHPYINWGAQGISQLPNREVAMQQFHGFVITFRPPVNAQQIDEELAYLETVLADLGTSAQHSYQTIDNSDPDRRGILVELERDELEDMGRIQMRNVLVAERFTEEDLYGDWAWRYWTNAADDTFQIDTVPFADVAYLLEKTEDPPPKLVMKPIVPVNPRLLCGPDTVLFSVMDRNSGWQDILVVSDVTGSMSPYTAQLFIWLEENQHRIMHYTFFNDGDDKPGKRKNVGSTGGIYHTNSNDIEEVFAEARKCIKNGYKNAEIIENNLEAVMEGIKACPDCKDIVMIADNPATPRDLSLVKKLERPIQIILCGPSRSFNPAYLNLARITGGGVHTQELSLTNLDQYQEGEQVTFGSEVFEIKDGKFVHVRYL